MGCTRSSTRTALVITQLAELMFTLCHCVQHGLGGVPFVGARYLARSIPWKYERRARHLFSGRVTALLAMYFRNPEPLLVVRIAIGRSSVGIQSGKLLLIDCFTDQ